MTTDFDYPCPHCGEIKAAHDWGASGAAAEAELAEAKADGRESTMPRKCGACQLRIETTQ
jgi:hypothetical protein